MSFQTKNINFGKKKSLLNVHGGGAPMVYFVVVVIFFVGAFLSWSLVLLSLQLKNSNGILANNIAI